MQPLSRNPPPDAARLSAMLWPALIAPAALLLMVTAALRSDSGLVLDALELLGASIIAGFLTALFVHRFGLAKSSGFWAGISWLIALGVPGAMVWVGGSASAANWLRSPMLQDAIVSVPQDIVTFALSFAIVLAAGLLGAGIGGDEKSPVVVRHRSAVIRERTLIPVFGLATLSLGMVRAIRQDRFAAGSGDELRAELPRLAREARRYPNHFRSQYLYGNGLSRAGDCAIAIAPLQRAIQLDASDGWALNDLAWSLSCTKRYSEAIVPYRASLRVMPNELRPRYGLAWALEQTRDKRGAEQQYHAILELWPNEGYALAREATLRYDRGERDDGLAEMRRALALGDTSYWVHFYAAQLFSSAALLPEALGQYKVLAARYPANVWLWAQYGSTAYLAGDMSEARLAFDHADSLDQHALDQYKPWADMRDAARRGVPSSALPPIPSVEVKR